MPQPDATDFPPAGSGWHLLDDSGFLGHVGPVWELRDADGIHLAFRAEPKHHNRRGVVQGGMIATILDRAMGLNVSEAIGGRAQATIQLDVHFLRAVQIGQIVRTRCVIDRKTSAVTFASGSALVGERVVATAKGVWKILGAS